MLRLPECVGSPLSIQSLTGDLQTSHKTVARWVDILERVYAIFRVPPFGAPKIRAVRKEQKHYHFDWTLVESIGFRFENLVACHLLKWVHFKQDTEGEDLELRYFRDVDGREVDFVVVKKQVPILFAEARWSDHALSPHLRYLKVRFPKCRAIQVVGTLKENYHNPDGIEVLSAESFLSELV